MRWTIFLIIAILLSCSEDPEISPSATSLSQSSFLLQDTVTIKGNNFQSLTDLKVNIIRNNGEVIELPTQILDNNTILFSIQDCCSPFEAFNGNWQVWLNSGENQWNTGLTLYRKQPSISAVQPREVHRGFMNATASLVTITGEDFNLRFKDNPDFFQIRIKTDEDNKSYTNMPLVSIKETEILFQFQMTEYKSEFKSLNLQLYIAGQVIDYPVPLIGKGIGILSSQEGQAGNFILIRTPTECDQLTLKWNTTNSTKFSSREQKFNNEDGIYFEYLFEIPAIGSGDFLLELFDPAINAEFTLHPSPQFKILL